jgi:hypothetical protein
VLAAGSIRSFKSKAALETHILLVVLDFNIRKGARRNGMRMLKSDHWADHSAPAAMALSRRPLKVNASVVDLTFASFLLRVRKTNVKSKTALETYIC